MQDVWDSTISANRLMLRMWLSLCVLNLELDIAVEYRDLAEGDTSVVDTLDCHRFRDAVMEEIDHLH